MPDSKSQGSGFFETRCIIIIHIIIIHILQFVFYYKSNATLLQMPAKSISIFIPINTLIYVYESRFIMPLLSSFMQDTICNKLNGSVKEPNISIYFYFPLCYSYSYHIVCVCVVPEVWIESAIGCLCIA